MRAALRNSVTLLAIASSLTCVGCSFTSTCNRDQDTVVISDGLVFGNTYISAPNDAENRGPFAHFPPARTLVFEHHLPSVPYQVEIWLAFQEYGNLAPSAGNSALRLPTNDNRTIRIKNDTCSEFWVWVQASIPSALPPQGEAGASGADPADAAEAGAGGTQ